MWSSALIDGNEPGKKMPLLAATDLYRRMRLHYSSRRTVKTGEHQTVVHYSDTEQGRRFFYIETGWELDEWIAALQQHIK